MQTPDAAATEILASHFERTPDAIKPETRLAEDLGADSLDRLELMMEFEERFAVDFDLPESELAKLATVGDVLEAVRNRVTGAAA